MKDLPETDVPQDTGAMIDHILTRYHEMHREDLASLMPLADRVERVHADDPDAPKGLAAAIRTLAGEMEDHMLKEEMILFPAMRAGGGPGIEHPIAVMREEHEVIDTHLEGTLKILRATERMERDGRYLVGGPTG